MGKSMKTKLYDTYEYENIVNDLLNGEVVGFPTETVYGLAIVYDNKEAFDKLYEIKNRSINKPISMMVASVDMLSDVAYIDKLSKKVIEAFMPGAITIILKAKEDLPEFVTFKQETIGIRIPTNEVALNILKKVNKPLLVSSANISSEPSLIKANDVHNKFDGLIASLINEDAINGISSTVVDVRNDIKIYRDGPISKKDIEKVLGE